MAVTLENETSALPPALSHEELLARADLAGKGQIVKIMWAPDKTSPHLALVRLEKTIKGKPRYRFPLLARLGVSKTIEIKMRRIRRDHVGHKLPGEWSDGYRVGDRIMTHLVWDTEIDGYRTLWWNAVWQTPLDWDH